MNIDLLLKKEGISNIKELDSNQIKIVSKDLAIKLCLAFPEHDLDRQALYNSFRSLDMYTATMPKDSSGAKYIANSNSIYFNEALDFSSIPEVAMHECIHFIQEGRLANKNGFIGLTSLTSGLAINEAAVQLMASEANMSNITEERYFGILIKTISPSYYPLECTLVNQISYFTGTYPLYHSVLNNNDVFKNTFIAKFNKRIYNRIVRQLDKLLHLETDLVCYTSELENTDKISDIKELNTIISTQKYNISKLFFNIQNFIIRNCFSCEFNHINTLEDLKELKKKLYDFKNVIGVCDGYTFYNDFYCDLMNALESKKEELLKYGEISLFKQECTALTVVDQSREAFHFVRIFIRKLKKLFKLNRRAINDYNENGQRN